MSYFRVNEKCNGCLACLQNCPSGAIDFEDAEGQRKLLHNMARCTRCCNCWRICPQEAVEFRHMLENQWDEVVVLDMLNCKVCGKPLYTKSFAETLAKKLGDSAPSDPLCEKHRTALALMTDAHFIGGKGRKK